MIITDADRCHCNHFPSDHHPLDGCIHCGQCTEYVRRGGPRPEIDDRMKAERESYGKPPKEHYAWWPKRYGIWWEIIPDTFLVETAFFDTVEEAQKFKGECSGKGLISGPVREFPTEGTNPGEPNVR